jgi:hypothetical protein
MKLRKMRSRIQSFYALESVLAYYVRARRRSLGVLERNCLNASARSTYTRLTRLILGINKLSPKAHKILNKLYN